MLLLNCPTCMGQFKSADSPGTKVACPSCGQRILIPQQAVKPAAANKTVIGQVAAAPSPQRPAAAGSVNDVEFPPLESQEEVAAQTVWSTGVIVGAALGSFAIVVLVIVVIILGTSATPSKPSGVVPPLVEKPSPSEGPSKAAREAEEYRAAMRSFVKEARVLFNLTKLNPSVREYSDQLGKAQTAMARVPIAPSEFFELDSLAKRLLGAMRNGEEFLNKALREPLPEIARLWLDGYHDECALMKSYLEKIDTILR